MTESTTRVPTKLRFYEIVFWNRYKYFTAKKGFIFVVIQSIALYILMDKADLSIFSSLDASKPLMVIWTGHLFEQKTKIRWASVTRCQDGIPGQPTNQMLDH